MVETIICSICGEKIMLLPDVKEMDQAIKNHAKKHAIAEKNGQKAKEVYDSVQNDLVEQVLFLASKPKNREGSSRKLSNGF